MHTNIEKKKKNCSARYSDLHLTIEEQHINSAICWLCELFEETALKCEGLEITESLT